MDSAIPSHLRCPRSRPSRVGDDFTPPYPCWSASVAPATQQVVMAYFGVQWQAPALGGRACAALQQTVRRFEGADGPGHHDLAHFVDAQGYETLIAIAYWRDPAAFERWQASSGFTAWWSDDARLNEGLGYFLEVAAPKAERFETMFNTPDRLEGVGVVLDGVSDPIREHSYWGSARERIPQSQTDALDATGALALEVDAPGPGRRVRVRPHHHVAMSRSGQEWGETSGKERELYTTGIEPVLRSGMDYLRDEGRAVGCYTNRYMRHVDAAGQPTEKTFGLSYWRSLSHMERWAESHPTHVAIFAEFMRYVQALAFQVSLRVYHEVSVLQADEQTFEYLNCHPATGLMNGVGG